MERTGSTGQQDSCSVTFPIFCHEIAYLGVDLTQDPLAVSSKNREERVLQAQNRQNHEASAAHALKVTQ